MKKETISENLNRRASEFLEMLKIIGESMENDSKNLSSSFKVNKKNSEVEVQSYESDVFKGIGLNKPVERIDIEEDYVMVKLSKENLSLPKNQRIFDENKAKNIQKNWYAPYSKVLVCEKKIKNKYHYFIADGQHNAWANPREKVTCVLLLDKETHIAFGEANDSSTNKAITKDDKFWNSLFGRENIALHLKDKVESIGLQAEREHKTTKEGYFTGMGTLFNAANKMRPVKRRKAEKDLMTEQDFDNERLQKFDYVFNLIFKFFDKSEFVKQSGYAGSSTKLGNALIWNGFSQVINMDSYFENRPKITGKLVAHFKREFKKISGKKLNAVNLNKFCQNSRGGQKVLMAKDEMNVFVRTCFNSYRVISNKKISMNSSLL